MMIDKLKQIFIEDWKRVALISYAGNFHLLSIACVIMPALIFAITGQPTNPIAWGWMSIGFGALGYLGRFVKQAYETRYYRRGVLAILSVAAMFWAAPAMAHECDCSGGAQGIEAVIEVPPPSWRPLTLELIAEFEGENKVGELHVAYFDVVKVPTACYGHTSTVTTAMVHAKKTWTQMECDDLLFEEVNEYREGLHAFFTKATLDSRLPYTRDSAFISLSYNVGVRAAGRSTAVKRMNRGDIEGACEAIDWWNKAGGQVLAGLVFRRSKERALCERGLTAA